MTKTEEILRATLAKRIVLLDGAMGTMIQRHKLKEADYRGERFAGHDVDVKGDNDLLVLTRPDIIADIHDQYMAAGSDLIETNTFNANAIAQADYKLESIVYELNVEAARLAKRVAAAWNAETRDKPRFVAGAFGPTNRTLSMSPDVNDAAFRAVTFDQYWGGRPKIDNLIFSITRDATARYAKLKTGECHAMAFPKPADLAEMKQDPALNVLSKEGLNIGYIAFNVEKKPFDNKLVRQALNMAIDKESILKAVYQGQGQIAKNPIPPILWGYNNAIKDYPYDAAKA